MSLVVNTNTASIGAQRFLNKNNMDLQHTISQLSSGLRIVSAADDPAGLGISERMKARVSSLMQASRNTADGVSLVQTAEGSLSQTQSMLSRMRELAVQAANGTLSSGDVSNLTTEFTQLASEVDRSAKVANFNGTALLDGSTASLKLQVGVDEDGAGPATNTITVNLLAADTAGLGLSTTQSRTVSTSFATPTTAVGGSAGTIDLTVGTGTTSIAVAATDTLQSIAGKINGAGLTGISAKVETNADGTSSLVVGGLANSGSLVETTSAVFGATPTFTAGGAINLATGAQAAITAIDTAINTVSTLRANLGAIQNRLQSANANTDTEIQNLTAAESQIRDVDVAQAAAALTRGNILQQAGVAVLAQANQGPQAALKLLG